ncbi:hypothetical protein FLL45_21315 [Aliikangiella marina]|uniref:Uncharacterized protein n=1 Tax=Aliikangiella marina TaxID=1712262 RepID=A0A545T0Y7_9GAMM|nr:hypothetical protein [Aliikangiella marina]TQV70870.1 hypothetical protein FLL45_21315 [Aliikangiella marina]
MNKLFYYGVGAFAVAMMIAVAVATVSLRDVLGGSDTEKNRSAGEKALQSESLASETSINSGPSRNQYPVERLALASGKRVAEIVTYELKYGDKDSLHAAINQGDVTAMKKMANIHFKENQPELGFQMMRLAAVYGDLDSLARYWRETIPYMNDSSLSETEKHKYAVLDYLVSHKAAILAGREKSYQDMMFWLHTSKIDLSADDLSFIDTYGNQLYEEINGERYALGMEPLKSTTEGMSQYQRNFEKFLNDKTFAIVPFN